MPIVVLNGSRFLFCFSQLSFVFISYLFEFVLIDALLIQRLLAFPSHSASCINVGELAVFPSLFETNIIALSSLRCLVAHVPFSCNLLCGLSSRIFVPMEGVMFLWLPSRTAHLYLHVFLMTWRRAYRDGCARN
jgi:hypothetical protein